MQRERESLLSLSGARRRPTKLAEIFNVSHEVISSIRSHSSGDESKVIRKHYQLYRNLKPMREALEKWATFLVKLSGGGIKPGEVVPLEAAGRGSRSSRRMR